MQEQSLTHALQPGPDCPSIEQIGRYADGALVAEERRQAEAHIATCPNCQAELSLLRGFATLTVRDDEADAVRWGIDELQRRRAATAGTADPKEPAVRRWLSASRLRPALVLTAVTVAVVFGYYVVDRRAPRLPADLGSDVTRSLAVSLRAPLGDQAEAPARLQWDRVSGAARYHVRLSEVDRQEIWSGDTASPSIDLPPEVRARLVPGKTVLWQVTAYGSANTAIAASNAERFRVVR